MTFFKRLCNSRMELLNTIKNTQKNIIITDRTSITKILWSSNNKIIEFHQEIAHWVLGKISLILSRSLLRSLRIIPYVKSLVMMEWWTSRKINNHIINRLNYLCHHITMTLEFLLKPNRRNVIRKLRNYKK